MSKSGVCTDKTVDTKHGPQLSPLSFTLTVSPPSHLQFEIIAKKDVRLGGRERGREREIVIDLLFHLFTHLLVDSCMGPDQGLNLQPWRIGATL